MTLTFHQILDALNILQIETTADGETITQPSVLPSEQELKDAYDQHLLKVLRIERNKRLKESDWTVLSDSPTSTAAWKTYRQALRDLPANTTDPSNPVWPTPPS